MLQFCAKMSIPDLNEPLRVGAHTIRNRLFQAPMSGVTDLPFRERAYRHGAGLVVSEMVASGELAKGRGGSRQRIEPPAGGLHAVQLAGCEPLAMAEAARIAEGEGADIVDINMGCPAKKVTGGYGGSALMRDLDHAVSLIDAVVSAVAVPVTVKMRLGWDDESRNAPQLAERAQQSGVSMIAVHGRTRCQFYQGRADWAAIAMVKQAVTIPVVANGDVANRFDAQKILTLSGADAVMVGRASYGAPWLAGTIASGGEWAPTLGIADYVVEHYEAMLAFYGVESGLRQARKHLGWYLERFRPALAAETRAAVLRSLDPAQVCRSLRFIFDPDYRELAA